MSTDSKLAPGVNSGFTLIEVMVALIVLSIGLLGISGLVLNTLKANDSSSMRSQAAILANSIRDNMRANLLGASVGPPSNYDVAYLAPYVITPASQACFNTTCTPAQIAQNDLNNWKNALALRLPTGDGQIVTVANGGVTTVTITVRWDDTRAVNVLTGTTGCGAPPCYSTLTLQSTLP
jgi:type IV pilus assembly protein PilV